jgi:phenylacetate-CoA ligase
MNDLRRVGELLTRFPELHFDVVEHLLASKHAQWLAERFARFEAYLAGSCPAPDHERAIVGALRQSIALGIPAYRASRHIRTFRDLPFCDKESLRAEPVSFIRREGDFADVRATETSGTTGPPVTILYSPQFYLEDLHLTVRKMVSVAGANLGPERFPTFCTYVDLRDARRDIEHVTVDPTGHVGVTLRLLIDESDGATLGRFFRLLQLLRPAVIGSRPHVFEMLNAYAALVPGINRYSPRCVISAGSFLSPRSRRETQELFGADVFVSYGLTEFSLVAFECRERNGYHVDETSILLEVIDRDGQPVADGDEGELVLSSLANRTMPLLRYRTGDVGAVDRRPCRCGGPGTRITSVRGRRAECFRFRSGVQLAPARFQSLSWAFPIVDFRVVQPGFERLEVLVEPSSPCDNVDRLVSGIEHHVRRMVPAEVVVAVQATMFDKSQNAERYVTRVKRDAL